MSAKWFLPERDPAVAEAAAAATNKRRAISDPERRASYTEQGLPRPLSEAEPDN